MIELLIQKKTSCLTCLSSMSEAWIYKKLKYDPPKIEFQGQLSLGNTGLNKCDWQLSPYCQVLRPLTYELEAHMNVAQT